MTPRRFLDGVATSSTGMEPVAAHVAHIRHLARTGSLEDLLASRHELTRADARRVARQTAPFIEQALHFLESSAAAASRVRPVLQYYGYLNLAVACVLIYRPAGWQEYRQHGAEDLSQQLKTIKLGSAAVRVRRGAIPLFHSIISSGELSKKKRVPLRDLLVAVPMLSVELGHAYNVRPYMLTVDHSLEISSDQKKSGYVSIFSFLPVNPIAPRHTPPPFPAKRMSAAMPILRQHYKLEKKTGAKRTYVSTQSWTEGNIDRATRFHERAGLHLINFGAFGVDHEGRVQHRWHYRPESPLLPTMTASLLFSFFLASLCRYRANSLDKVQNSSFNLLCEVFGSEADGYMIPAFRNLLYGEMLLINRSHFV